MSESMFLVSTLAILLFSGSLLARDLRAHHEAERRVRRVPVRV